MLRKNLGGIVTERALKDRGLGKAARSGAKNRDFILSGCLWNSRSDCGYPCVPDFQEDRLGEGEESGSSGKRIDGSAA